MISSLDQHRQLMDHLLRQLAAEDDDASLIETHISTVLLAGDSAYKIKKPVNLGFLDFSSLSRRHHFCLEEIRLNRRLEADIYLGVIPVTGSIQTPHLGGGGDALEYAVHMRRFSQEGLLTNHPQLLDQTVAGRLAQRLGAFHASIARCGVDQPYGTPDKVLLPMQQNFLQVQTAVGHGAFDARLNALSDWTRDQFTRLRSVLERRREEGFIRECHGDLHLGNIALEGERLIIFDGIEFNPDLRWIDTVSELAFLLMDMEEKGLDVQAWWLLNRYLEITGDYPGLELLRFYQVYRAMVRAKVTAMQLRQQHEMGRAWDEFTAYLDQACAYTRRQPPRLLITHGLSGSGKSTITEALLSRLPAVRLRSDVERKRLAGLDAGADSGSAVDQGIYSTDFSQATYQRLELLAQQLLQAGFNVIVDATFLKQAQRRSFQALARRSGAAFLILDFPVPVAELKRRLIRRKRKGCDPSEADVAVLRVQLTQQEPLTEDERSCSLPASRPAAELAALVDGFLCRKKRGESEIGRGGQE